jgi:DNA-binding NarL/FixJ family response regulator
MPDPVDAPGPADPAGRLDVVRVWVDDGHAIVRRGMTAALVTAGMTVTGESSGLVPHPPLPEIDVLVLEAGATAPTEMLAEADRHRVRLVVTVRAVGAGQWLEQDGTGMAAVLTHQGLTPDLLVATVRAVAEGRPVPVPPSRGRPERAPRPDPPGAGTLNPREREVLRMLALGEDTRGIAVALCYSERTVKNVVRAVLAKLGCRTRAQAVGMATRAGEI